MKDAGRNVVAIASLGTPIEIEAKALAADLGTTAYEERLTLTAGLPAIVLETVDQAAAHDLAAKLRARGHRVVVCRAADVVPASSMITLRQFQIDHDALEAGGERLPWADVTALVRARHRRQNERVETVKHKKFDAGRALMTGGLVMRKTEKREVVTRTEESEQVLYLFHGGDTPWLLREQATNYAGLGRALEPTANRNFAIAVERFRAAAPHARFDDSLLRRPTITDVDLYAHLIASA